MGDDFDWRDLTHSVSCWADPRNFRGILLSAA